MGNLRMRLDTIGEYQKKVPKSTKYEAENIFAGDSIIGMSERHGCSENFRDKS